MSGNTFAKDYIEVHERIAAFYKKHPEGSLQARIIELSESRVVMEAAAYRTPDDPRPGIGYSSLGIPGATPYTRGSEIENCETSAWGRAIAALGFEVKRGIASADEVRNKTVSAPAVSSSTARTGHEPAAPATPSAGAAELVVLEGRAQRGRPPVDGELRTTPDGEVYGFALHTEDGRKVQVLAEGGLALPLSMVSADLIGQVVTCEGALEMVRWDKKQDDGTTKAMPPFRRLHLTRIAGDEFVIPADLSTGPAMVPEDTEAQLDAALGAA